MKEYFYSAIAQELAQFSHCFDHVLYGVPHDFEKMGLTDALFDKIKSNSKNRLNSSSDSSWNFNEHNEKSNRLVVLNSVLNHHFDLEQVFSELHKDLRRNDRLVMIAYNPYLEWLFKLATLIGIRKGELPKTYVTKVDLDNIARLSRFQVTIERSVVYLPFDLFGLGKWVNKICSVMPLVKHLSFAYFAVLRPIKPNNEDKKPSLSIVIPARNEKGNIRQALTRMPDLGCDCEVIFVEGNSTDGTYAEIELAIKDYQQNSKSFQNPNLKLSLYRQSGKGKNDAVQRGFENANGELLTILDADLTMPPEMIGRFYQAWCLGLADFINGSRLVYPMEGEAMRFLNWLGNIFFAKALSKVLGVRLGDTLCGTKLFTKNDYLRFRKWNQEFGKFDPFGDFELIFPAACLGLGVVDVPIRYLARTYGTTNISRFRHGLMLLKMTWIGFWRIRLAKG